MTSTIKIVIFNNSMESDYSFLNPLARGMKTVLTRVRDLESFRLHIYSGEYGLGVLDLGVTDKIDNDLWDELSGLKTPLLVIGGRINDTGSGLEKTDGSSRFRPPGCFRENGQGHCLDMVIALVATLSHEINNPLQSILAHVEMLAEEPFFKQDDVRIRLEKITDAVLKIQEALDHLTALESLQYRNVPGGRMLAFDKIPPMAGK